MAKVPAPRHLHWSTCTSRIPPDVSLPMPMHAQTLSVNVQFEMYTSSVGRAIVYPSIPRPDFSEMQSPVVSKSQPSIVTFLQESISIPSAPLDPQTHCSHPAALKPRLPQPSPASLLQAAALSPSRLLQLRNRATALFIPVPQRSTHRARRLSPSPDSRRAAVERSLRVNGRLSGSELIPAQLGSAIEGL